MITEPRRPLIALATLAALWAAAAAPAAGQATIGGEWREDVDRFARRVVDAGLAPGLSLAVATGDWVAHAAGSGNVDRATGRPVDGDTPFYIASSTKSLTALAVVLASQRGELDLEAPLVEHLPDVRFPDGVDPSSVTLDDLLAMRHGLSGRGPVVLLTAFIGEDRRQRIPPLVRFHESTGEAGTFAYNNLGYNLLGLVLEARYGTSWKDVVRREVLAPAGMSRTSARLSRLPGHLLALPHQAEPDGFARMRLAKRDANLHAAGGHFASARDLARYLAVHLGDGTLNGERVLPAAAVRSTHEPVISQDRDFGPYHRHAWAYGWDVGTFEGDTLLHRFGAFAGYFSHLSFMPDHDVGVAVLVNGEQPAGPAANLVANYAYGRLLGKPDLEETYAARLDSLEARAEEARSRLAAHREERRARRAQLSYPLSAYGGVYRNPVLGRMEWRVVAGGLEMRLGVIESRAEVYDASADELRIEFGGSGTVVGFALPEDGGPARAATLFGIRFERVAGGG